jgi:hypothetical protein
LTGPVADAARGKDDTATTAYPRLLRIFTGSIVIAVLCGFTAVATEGGKELHPAPFLTLAALSAITAASSFVCMLICLLAEAIQSLRRR